MGFLLDTIFQQIASILLDLLGQIGKLQTLISPATKHDRDMGFSGMESVFVLVYIRMENSQL